MKNYHLFRSQLEQELDNAYIELNDIISITESEIRITKLREFAIKNRASIIQFPKGYDYASEPELIHNIHIALQTKAMIATVKTTSNYVIVTIILAFIAFASMIVSIIAAIK